jgi:hypothetical protein
MLEIQEDFREEYQNLTKDERDELVKNFKEEKSTLRKIPCPTARGRVQDVANVTRNICELVGWTCAINGPNTNLLYDLELTGLNFRVGIEGFFCIVRSSPDFHMHPYIYYTTPALEDYMKIVIRKRWDTTEVGAKIEAFAVAGSNVLSMC